jgi:hypothetical protein
MARRTFVVVDITEIHVHWYAGRSKSALAASLGVDRKRCCHVDPVGEMIFGVIVAGRGLSWRVRLRS